MNAEQYSWVAPFGTRCRPKQWEGRCDPKPWDYRVSVCIPHLNTPEPLEMCIATLQNQTVVPYIMVIDTGSTPATCVRLERFRSESVEIHYIRSHGYIHSSEPVCVALDLAHALCRTPCLYHTHSDVFVRRRDWLAWLLDRCSAARPVVGYEMTKRQGTEDWRGCVSHTATMLHMPTIRRLGATWSMQRWYEIKGKPDHRTVGWPDTESMFGHWLKAHQIAPYFVTPETCPGSRPEVNFARQTDCNIDHCRSHAGSALYSQTHHAKAEAWMALALTEARDRVKLWAGQAAAKASTTKEVDHGRNHPVYPRHRRQ